ncbi:MAG: hypothetical protein LBS82_01265 [Spirochaetaceae bacterium]|jgi:hypothetical protein|nr:hypothetical protein [Spirochaetaceae bacterium]
MDTVAAVIALLKELGTPAITIVGFAWVLFRLKKLEAKGSSDIAALDAKFSAGIAALDAKFSAGMAALDAKFSAGLAALRADVQSIKGNHLPHIEAAIKALAKGTPNEENVKAILDLSREVELRTENNEQAAQVTGGK